MERCRFWKRGAGEFIGYTVTVTFLVYILILGLSAMILFHNIRLLEQCAQRAARECVTAHNLAGAQRIAQLEAEKVLQNHTGVSDIRTSVTMAPISGTEWKKGSYIYVAVSAYLSTMDPLTSGRRDCVVMIMVEHEEDDEEDQRLREGG